MSSNKTIAKTEVIDQSNPNPKKFKFKKKLSNSDDSDSSKNKYVKSTEEKPTTFKDIVQKIIALKRMYPKFKEYRINILNGLKTKYKFRGQKAYAIEYMLQYPTKMVKQGDLLLYCDKRRNKDTNGKKPNFKDNSRAIETLRKDIIPNCWMEKRPNGELYFIYLPELKELVTDEIIENTKYKNEGFSKEILVSKLENCNYKCELTGLPKSEGHLAGDHWIPKEGGGESKTENCVILNKILNEKKNNHDPIDWFCKFLLTNFLNICKRTGMDLNTIKVKLINFIQEF